jgi:tetratricopeptide (TPR) repeat protein
MFLSVCFFLGGCSYQPFASIGQIKKGIETKAIQRRLEEGNRFFQEGKYKEAEKIFESLRHIENPLAVRQAVYGLACTRLRLAENRKQYLEAAKLLDQWFRTSSVTLGPEDPRMLLPFIPEKAFSKPRGLPGGDEVLFSTEEPLLMHFYDYEQEINKLLRRLAEMEKQIQAAEDREAFLKTMKMELETLRNQIKSVEAIDQEIQKKKQGISSP